MGHSDAVQSVSFSPDGNRIVSGSYSGEVKLWDSRSGMLIRSLDGHSTPVRVGFSLDGTRILSDSFDGKNGAQIVWDLTGQHLMEGAAWPDEFKQFSKTRHDSKLLRIEGLAVLIINLRKQGALSTIAGKYPLYSSDDPRAKEEVENWFGAAFDYGWLLKIDAKGPGDLNEDELLKGLQKAYSKLQTQFKEDGRDLDAVLPPVVKEAIELLPKNQAEYSAGEKDAKK